jgi:EAL domain-containing protein (putative c-di-GMP-specific phosphodiesterase class I)
MRDQEGNIVAPGAFLPAAERYNLTAQIDRWVVENYFIWLASNPQHNAQLTRVSINLSGHSLADKELKLFVLNAFEKHKIPYKKVCFEITESMAILKMDETLEFINTFHKLGCLFALDDFGTGYSSLSYLKKLPVNRLKIDKSFIIDIPGDADDIAITNAIIGLAHTLNLEVIAEGVETQNQVSFLAGKSCDYQGFLFSKPLDAEAVPSFIQNLIDRHES